LPKLTTTSFALLGLLHRQPWSAYELTGFMRKSILRAVWPRAESHLYSEPKLLEKRGLVESSQEHNGARKRTVYRITESGRTALVEWLGQEAGAGFQFEYELLVRLAFSESLPLPWAGTYLAQARDDAYRDAREALSAVNVVMDQSGGFADAPGAAYAGAIINLITEKLQARLDWAEQMEGRFAALENDAQRSELALDLYSQARDKLQHLLGRQDAD
jgi:PadR family transcriptional regulator AphA